MEVYEITAFETSISRAGVNYLQPSDSFQNLENGFVYRQVLQSRQGVGFFSPKLNPISPLDPPQAINSRRVYGIFEHTLPNSSKELLAFDANFLYKFNEGTGVFDQIPFGGSMAPAAPGEYPGFNITANDFYISGTSYPTAQFLSDASENPAYISFGGNRFVFCGEGITPNSNGSAIFFYNGTDVRDFTDVSDNPNYAAPPEGALQIAEHVLWFNERLNFVVPTIESFQYYQGVLYSGIRDNSGNGDKFNVVGSGLFEADTYQFITGASIRGQIIVLNFDRSAYTLEKTTDAFNPYFGRLIPSVLGTNAKFSPVVWFNEVSSLGNTGILTCDGRQNLKIDNRIPNFTREEIDQIEFNLTYGGFDRLYNQFLWSYKKSESATEDEQISGKQTQNSVLVLNYEEKSWAVFDQRFSVFGQTDIGLNLTWDQIDETSGNESWAQWDTTEEIWDRIGLGKSVQKTLAGDDYGFIYELNRDYDDYFTTISAIAQGSTTTLTVAATAILKDDMISISNVEGMTEINNFDTDTNVQTGDLYKVISATNTSIEIDVDSTNFTAYTQGGSLTKAINFYAETIPFNPYRSQGRRVYVSHVEFLMNTNGGFILCDVKADEEETPFIQNVKLQPTQNTQASEWISFTVDQEANFLTFIMKQQSPALQLKITSIRIHAKMGGMTYG